MAHAHLPIVPPVSLPPISYKGVPVLTTEMLAQAYGCSPKNIRDNYANNRERFIDGKHSVTLTNGDLRDFRLQTENFGSQISSKARHIILWTERGAARHAKMLNTDTAWDMYELLEETFFRVAKPEPQPALPALKRTALPAPSASYHEQCADITARMLALRGDLFRVSAEMEEIFCKPFWKNASAIPEDTKPFARAMTHAIQSFCLSVNKDLDVMRLLFNAYVEAEKILNR